MCGFSGIVFPRGRSVEVVELLKSGDAIKHRGPDSSGYFLDENVGMTHQRLSIIDLSDAGHQPMTDQGSGVSIVFNGEIYNFKELRLELEALGHKFRSNSDTEVVLRAWIEWREAAIRKFNGMFAIGIFDKRSHEILLVRDRYGIKPVYFSLTNDYLIFGSEQRAISAVKFHKQKLDLEAIHEYLTFQNLISGKTFDEGIRLLPPASILRLDLSDWQSSTKQYWDFNFKSDSGNLKIPDILEELDYLAGRAVERQLVSDVEVGGYLSGGIDSATVMSYASAQYPNMRSFTVGFETAHLTGREHKFDERGVALDLSLKMGTRHLDYELTPSDFETSLDLVTKTLEEPRVGQSYPNYFAAKLASENVKVVLSGAAGDELFAGYPWRYGQHLGSKTASELSRSYFREWNRLLPGGNLANLLSPISTSIDFEAPKQVFSSTLIPDGLGDTHLDESSALDLCLRFEAKTFLHGLLVVEDKLSMHFGLETRLPFLDNDLVDFATKLPIDWRLHKNSETDQPIGKFALRKLAQKKLGAGVATARKQGFSSPDQSWFKNENRDFLLSRFNKRSSRLYDLLNFDLVQEMINDHMVARANNRLFIWSALSIQNFVDS